MKVSVVLSVFNGEKFIEKCLNSIRSQTYKNLEILVYNDGSTDNSIQYLQKAANEDPRIRLLDSKRNEGMGFGFSHLLNQATGEYIAQIGHDDYWQPEFIEELVNELNANPHHVAAFSAVEIVGSRNAVSPFKNEQAVGLSKEQLFLRLLQANFLCASSSLFRRSALQNAPYLGDNDYFQDWSLWLYLSLLGTFTYVPKKLANYSIHENNQSYLIKWKRQFSLEAQTAVLQVIGSPAFAKLNSDKVFAAIISRLGPSENLLVALKTQEQALRNNNTYRSTMASLYWWQGLLTKALKMYSDLSALPNAKNRYVFFLGSVKQPLQNSLVRVFNFSFISVAVVKCNPTLLPKVCVLPSKNSQTLIQQLEYVMDTYSKFSFRNLISLNFWKKLVRHLFN